MLGVKMVQACVSSYVYYLVVLISITQLFPLNGRQRKNLMERKYDSKQTPQHKPFSKNIFFCYSDENSCL